MSLSPLFSPLTFLGVLLGCAGLVLLPYIPYYFTYFNPLLGGSLTAPALVKIGWGEGLDQASRFLQRELRDSRVGTAYASTLAPYFEGKLTSVTADELDFVVLYLKQVQGGEPSPAFIRYFEQTPAIFSVDLNGIDYAKIYSGPTLRRSLAVETKTASPAGDALIPTDFRALHIFGGIGEPLEVDVIWQAGSNPSSGRVNPPLGTATLTLQPEAALDQTAEGAETKVIFAEAQGQQVGQGDEGSLIISRHQLHLPETLERGTYALLVEGHPLGTIDLRRFQLPAEMNPVENVLFADQIALRGYQFEPTADYVGMTVAWQALKSGLPDYTVFVQLLEAENQERRAGVDLQPLKGEWPTSRWARGEVIVDEYLVAVPPDLRPGAYLVIIGLYQPQTGQRLVLEDGRDYWLVPWTFIRKE